MKHNKEGNHDMPKWSVDVPENSRSKLLSGVAFLPTGVHHRLFENVQVWVEVKNFLGRGNDAYVIVFVPKAEFDLPGGFEGTLPHPTTPRVVLGTTWGGVVFEKIADRVTRITHFQKVDFACTSSQTDFNSSRSMQRPASSSNPLPFFSSKATSHQASPTQRQSTQ